MIIIRGNETQSLPNQTGLPNRQYAGEGSALSAAGPAVANTANRGVALGVQLNDHYARLEGAQKGKQLHSDLRSAATKFLDQWDHDYVQQGASPDVSVGAVEEFFANHAAADAYSDATSSDNPYLKQYAQSAFADIKADTLAKAVPHARTGYIAFGRSNIDVELEKDKIQALQAAAAGRIEDYKRISDGSLLYINDFKGSFLNDAEAAKKAQEYSEDLQTRLATQTVAKHPQEFLDGYYTGKYEKMKPKEALSLVGTAHSALHNQAQFAQHAEVVKRQQVEDLAKSTEQDFYSRSVERDKNGHPITSTEILLAEAGVSMALGDKKPQTISYLQARLAHEKAGTSHFDATYFNRTLLPNIYKGKYTTELDVLKAGADYLDAPHMTQAIEQFHTYRNQVTHRITQDFDAGERLITGTFKLPPGASIDPAGVMEAGNHALDRYNTWYTAQVANAAKQGPNALSLVDIQSQARTIRDEEYSHLQNNLIPILQATRSSLRYKTAEEVKKAHEKREIETREANMYLQQIQSFEHLQEMSANKITSSSKSDKGNKGAARIGKD
jgi:hypothetical protein